jgi:signal transduction histidine kinase
LQPQVDIIGFERPVYDWRELERWNIDPSRLPPGSEIRFRPPSLWDQHRMAIIATGAVLLLQAALIAGLLIQRGRRRRAEQEAQHLGGRILTAQEDERRRLAREMHDDVTQRLAALAIDAARMQNDDGSTRGNALETIRERLVGLSEDVHALSYRLHPSVIEDLGLVAALRVECNRVARQEPIRVDFDARDVPAKVPSSTGICLFRVAQEALRNVVRHARASNVEVSLEAKNGGITLAVRDDGRGLGESSADKRASLGLVSMRERVRLVGGKLDIVSRPNQGTSVVAWVPMREAA